MRLTLLLFPIFISLRILSQELPRIERDTLYTSSGYKVVAGSYLTLGTGALANGDFKYVINASKAWSLSGKPFTKKMNGKSVRVKGLRREGSKKKGFNYYLLIEAEAIPNAECDIENAIASREIIVPDEFQEASGDSIKTIKTAVPGGFIKPSSVADEIRKLKELLDQGAITQKEFDEAKRKLLNP